MDFEWDASKDLVNIRKHRVSFLERCETFSDSKGFSLEDKKHSSTELRFYWVGKSSTGRILTTRYTKRGSVIRIFGCAEWRQFRRLYETTKTE